VHIISESFFQCRTEHPFVDIFSGHPYPTHQPRGLQNTIDLIEIITWAQTYGKHITNVALVGWRGAIATSLDITIIDLIIKWATFVPVVGARPPVPNIYVKNCTFLLPFQFEPRMILITRIMNLENCRWDPQLNRRMVNNTAFLTFTPSSGNRIFSPSFKECDRVRFSYAHSEK